VIQGVHVKLNPGMPCQKRRSTGCDYFDQQTGLESTEKPNKMSHLKHSFLCCRNLDTFEKRAQIFVEVLKCRAAEE